MKTNVLTIGSYLEVLWLTIIHTLTITNYYSGCNAIVPTSSLRLTTIAAFDFSSAMPKFAYLQSTSYTKIFKFNETDQPVNSSFCTISSLEVYWGREQVIEISHQGFLLNNNGSVEVCLHTIIIILSAHTYCYCFRLLQIN